MTLVIYRSQQRGRRGQRIATSERQEVRSSLLDRRGSCIAFFLHG